MGTLSPMRTNPKKRALFVVAAAAIAAAVAGSQAFGTTARHFASSPRQARYGHVPNTLNNRSFTPCPVPGQVASVALMQGTTTLASASVTSNSRGKWAVAMSIPTNLQPGEYAVTASCSDTAGGPPTLSYNPRTFKVIAPFCPSDTSTSTTVACRSTTTSTSTSTTI